MAMRPTNTMAHFNIGGNSVLGLQVMLDDNGQEFVQHASVWVHVDEMPHPKLHRAEIGSWVPKPKRVPTVIQAPQIPVDADGKPFPAFAPIQRVATGLHPDSPVLKEKA